MNTEHNHNFLHCDDLYCGDSRCAERLERAKHKLRWFVKAGYDFSAEGKRTDLLSGNDVIRFFASVTVNERKVSGREFYALWSDEAAARRREIRIDHGYLRPDGTTVLKPEQKRRPPRLKKLVCNECRTVFESLRRDAKRCPKCRGLNVRFGVRLCASGERCFGADRLGTPAPAAAGKQYCTTVCHDCDLARRRRAMGKAA